MKITFIYSLQQGHPFCKEGLGLRMVQPALVRRCASQLSAQRFRVGIGLHHILHGQLQRQRRRVSGSGGSGSSHTKGGSSCTATVARVHSSVSSRAAGVPSGWTCRVLYSSCRLPSASRRISPPARQAKGSNIPAPRPDRCAGPVPARGHTAQAAQSGPLCPVRAAKAGRTRSVGRPGPAAASRSPAAKHVLHPWGTSLINNADAVF